MSAIISEQDLISAFDVSIATDAIKINSYNLESEIANGTWRGIHLDRTRPCVEQWLRTEAQVPDLAIDPLLADETRPRVQSIEQGYIINLRGVNLNPNASPEDMVAIRLWIDLVILPFLMGCNCRIYAAILSFCIGVIPPMPILGRSLLYVHSHRVA